LALGAGWCAVAVAVAIPVSVAATSVFVTAAILTGLAAGLYTRHWRALLTHPAVWFGLLLFAWLALSMTYTAAPVEEAWRLLKKYRELLLIPLLMPLLLEPRIRRWVVRGFVAAMLVTLVLSYVEAFRQLLEYGHLEKDPEVFKHRITQSILLAFTAYWAWLQAERYPAQRGFWLTVVGLIAVNVFVMMSGRSGQVVFLTLATLALYQRFRWKGVLMAGALGGALLGSAYGLSDLFRDRVLETLNGLTSFEAREFKTSTAVRISYYPNSLALIGQRPLLGHGVGSIGPVYREQVAGTPFPATMNPHNEFLAVGIQAGIPAMLMLVAWFASHWRQGRRLPPERWRLMQGVLVTMVVGCLFNSFLMDSTEGHWYALFTALLLYPRDGGETVP
jgi:O-antigen ligase